MKTARSFAIAFVAFVLINGAFSQLLGRFIQPLKNGGKTFFKLGKLEAGVPASQVFKPIVSFPTVKLGDSSKMEAYDPTKYPTDRTDLTPIELDTDFNKEDLPKKGWFSGLFTPPSTPTTPSTKGFKWYDYPNFNDYYNTKSFSTWNPNYVKEILQKDPNALTPWKSGELVETYVPVMHEDPAIINHANDTNLISASDFTKLNGRTVNINLGLDDHSVDLTNVYPTDDKDVEEVELLNTDLDNKEAGELQKNETVKYFSLKLHTANRTICIKIGKFSRNLTVEYFITKFKQLQNITKPVADIFHNPLVSYVMSKTPLAKPFDMVKTALKMIQKPEEAYKMFQKKYPVSSVFVDLSIAIYKDPKNTKKHVKDAIPKLSEKIVEWHKNKEKEAADKEKHNEERSLVAMKLKSIRRN